MWTASALRLAGNKLYYQLFPIYRPLYAAYKAYADRAERQLLKRTLSAGDVVVDAGANIGIYSQFLSHRVGRTGVVHSFEPSPENFRRLQSATRKLANVRLSQAAVGERSGQSKFYIGQYRVALVNFFRNRELLQRLNDKFDASHFSARPFSALSYMITGGISHRLPVPCSLYRMLIPVDLVLSRCFPRFCAAFCTVALTRR